MSFKEPPASKGFQIARLKELFGSLNAPIASDMIDWDAFVDPSLHLDENIDKLESQFPQYRWRAEEAPTLTDLVANELQKMIQTARENEVPDSVIRRALSQLGIDYTKIVKEGVSPAKYNDLRQQNEQLRKELEEAREAVPPPPVIVTPPPPPLTSEQIRQAYGPLYPIINAMIPAGNKIPGLPIPPTCPPQSFTDIKDLKEEETVKLFSPFYDAIDAIRTIPEGVYFVCLQNKVFFKRTFISTSGRLPQQRLASVTLPQLARELRAYLPRAKPEMYGPGAPEFLAQVQERVLAVGSRVVILSLNQIGTVTQAFRRGASYVYTVKLDSGETVSRFSEDVEPTRPPSQG